MANASLTLNKEQDAVELKTIEKISDNFNRILIFTMFTVTNSQVQRN